MKKSNKKMTKILINLIILIIIVAIIIFTITSTKKAEKIEYVAELQNIAGSKKEEALKVEIKQKEIKEVVKEEEKPKMDSNYKGFSIVGKIAMPKIEIEIPIIDRVTVLGMNEAPCLLYKTGEINKSGNTYIVGHNYMNGTLFSNNGKLEIGDKIYITALDNSQKEYTIYNKFITTPEDVEYLKREIGEEPEITLQSCADDNINRIIILAK